MTEDIKSRKRYLFTTTSLTSLFRVASVGFIFLIASFMIRIPGPVEPLPNIEIGGALLGPSNIYVFLLTGLAGLYLILDAVSYNRTQILFPRSIKYIFGICVAILLSSFVNASFNLGTLTEVLQWVGLALLVAIVANFLQSEAEIRLLLRILILVALFKAVFVLCNLIVFGIPIGSYGTVVMGMGLLTILVYVFHNGITKGRVAGALLLTIPIALSTNRKGILGILFAILTVKLWWYLDVKKEREVSALWPTLGLTGVPVLMLIIIAPSLQTTIFQILERTLLPLSRPRYYIYQTGVEMFSENPLFGVGPDNWHEAKPIYLTPGLEALEGVENKDWGAHSFYLKVLTELGLLGFVPFILLTMLPLKQASHFTKQQNSNSDLWGVVFAFGIYFSAMATVSAISKPLQVGWFVTFGLSAILAILTRQREYYRDDIVDRKELPQTERRG